MIKLNDILSEITIKKGEGIDRTIIKYFFSSSTNIEGLYNAIKRNVEQGISKVKSMDENHIILSLRIPKGKYYLLSYIRKLQIPALDLRRESVIFYSGFDMDDLNTVLPEDEDFETLGGFLKAAVYNR